MLFLESLNLKSVISLVLEGYPEVFVELYGRFGVELVTFGIEGNKRAFKGIDKDEFKNVMRIVMDPQKRPLLILCNKGKHRTCCVIGCI